MESIWPVAGWNPILAAARAKDGHVNPIESPFRHRLNSPQRHRALVRRLGSLTWLSALVACALAGGCVQRRLTIRSNPPGALVYVDDYQVGTTPVSTDFIYYGTRKVRLVKSGYETLTVLQPIPAPWYEYPGLDFVSENLVPGEIRDERVIDYELKPQLVVPSEQLQERAENLRHGAAGPGVAPPPAGPSYGPPRESRPGLPASPPPATRPGSPFSH
jgi:hypothetical protein